jgi:hypothetical protein
MEVAGAALLVLRAGLEGHGSQQEHRGSQSHRQLSHWTLLLFTGLPIEEKHHLVARFNQFERN